MKGVRYMSKCKAVLDGKKVTSLQLKKRDPKKINAKKKKTSN